ncbi:GFA family protein [Jeongeupia sp. USM3]|uniref:GFA family protein n=1 Tax=Jeongeupia sp. USM3 TaxID=1906741 RepID=UPI00089DEFED|nr:GFA family protein [Jeongeupia sp. USM3]AOY00052.1 aldehyde-activating protein [Jeongeupia sp. USM3]
MTHRASCHCGRIAFEVDGEIGPVTACNCSICQRRGHLLWFVPRASVRLLTPEADMSTYTFNKHVIQHRFCPTCGCGPFGEGVDPAGNPIAAVNVRCIEGIEIGELQIRQYDGRSK